MNDLVVLHVVQEGCGHIMGIAGQEDGRSRSPQSRPVFGHADEGLETRPILCEISTKSFVPLRHVHMVTTSPAAAISGNQPPSNTFRALAARKIRSMTGRVLRPLLRRRATSPTPSRPQ